MFNTEPSSYIPTFSPASILKGILPIRIPNPIGINNIETVEDQKVRTAFLKVGETKIELLEPTCPESTIAKFIENKGAGVHHVAFAVEDGVANALAEAESKEIRLIDKAPRKGAEGLNIAFLHPKSTLGVLTELCEH